VECRDLPVVVESVDLDSDIRLGEIKWLGNQLNFVPLAFQNLTGTAFGRSQKTVMEILFHTVIAHISEDRIRGQWNMERVARLVECRDLPVVVEPADLDSDIRLRKGRREIMKNCDCKECNCKNCDCKNCKCCEDN